MSTKPSNSPAMLDVIFKIQARIVQAKINLAVAEFSTDAKLAWLVGGVGRIATSLPRNAAVLDVAAVALAWLEYLHLSDMDILERIATERVRQKKLFTDRVHHFRVDSPVVDWTRKLRVLVEEVGEVAQAIDRLEQKPQSKKRKAHLVTELIQVAAVAVAWLESLEGK